MVTDVRRVTEYVLTQLTLVWFQFQALSIKKMTLRIPEKQEMFGHSSTYTHFKEDRLTWYYLLHISLAPYNTCQYVQYFKNKKIPIFPILYVFIVSLYFQKRETILILTAVLLTIRAQSFQPVSVLPVFPPVLHAFLICPMCHT